MAVKRSGVDWKGLRTLYAEGAIGGLTDGQLLERFVAHRDEAVFEALVERHGPMVLQVCRGTLGNACDADDAFQATFLVLVRRAGSIRNRDSVASWLFGVARRIAARARVDAVRRRKHERRAAELARRPDIQEERSELGRVLCEEVARLPEKYREVVVLCDLEGYTYESAARQIGRPVGTVKVRLSRARRQLLGRLTRRGLGLPAGVMAHGATAEATAVVPPALVRSTVQAVLRPSASAATGLAARATRNLMMTRTLGAAAVCLCAGLIGLGAAVLFHWAPTQQAASVRKAAPPSIRRDSVLVRVVDTSGAPVAGARVGGGAYASSKDARSGWQFYVPRAESDPAGLAELMNLKALGRDKVLLYALQERLGLAGFQEVSRDDLGTMVTLTVAPACRVRGRLTSSRMAGLNRPVGWTNVYVHRDTHRPLSFSSESQEYRFVLPPGIYKLSAYGTDLDTVETRIVVKNGMRDLDVPPLDLPPTRVATLLGRPAPELQQITDWKNGGPVRLADLRGKVVVLDFWGHWCGPCLRAMPALMALHDQFADRGLVVIAVHDKTLRSTAELDKRIADARQRRWFGRDLPFRVALDGDGATTAAYGITTFPTSLLIDRDGNVARQLHIGPSVPDDNVAAISGLLGVDGKRPPWQDRFNEIYGLAPGEILRHVKPPFISERDEFITREINAPGNEGPADRRLVLWWDGVIRPRYPVGSSLPDILRHIVADGGLTAPGDTFEFADGLRRLDVPGDWIVRDRTTLEGRLDAFRRAVKEGLGRSIHFERRRVMRDAVVVSGRYSPRPISKELPELHLSADNRDLDSERGGGEGTMDELLSSLSFITGLRFVDEATVPAGTKIRWTQHDSSLELGRLAELLANLSRQTSLEFRRQVHLVDVWAVLEE
jgi:RNA polymerase sigma factor (sigma-70 family)